MSKQSLQKSTTDLGWDDLRTVLAVARAGSLAGAARALGLQHSTVFRRMEDVERRLGTRLFDRSRQGWSPNGRGEVAVRAAEAMEAAALAAARELSGTDTRLEGVVRLATSELLASHLLPPLAARFLQAHEGVQIEVDAANRNLDLTRREADLALRATPEPPQDLVGRRVAGIRYAMYAAPALLPADGSVPDLRSLPWLGFDERISRFEIARWFQQAFPDLPTRFRADSLPTLMKAAVAGVGAAVLPAFAAAQERGLVRLSALIEGPEMGLWVLSHPDVRGNARVKALANFLIEQAPTEIDRWVQCGVACSSLVACPRATSARSRSGRPRPSGPR